MSDLINLSLSLRSARNQADNKDSPLKAIFQKRGGNKRKLEDSSMDANKGVESRSKKLRGGSKRSNASSPLPKLDCVDDDLEGSEVPGRMAGTSPQAPPTQGPLATPTQGPLATSTQAVGTRTPAKRIKVSPINSTTPFISCRKRKKKETEPEISFSEAANQTAALFTGGTGDNDWVTPFTRLTSTALSTSFAATTGKRSKANTRTEADALWLEEINVL